MEYFEVDIFDDEGIKKLIHESSSMEEIPKIQNTMMGDKNSDIGIVLQHGFVGTNIEMMYIANEIAKKGYRVCLPVLPGHGINYQAMNDYVFEDWIAQTKEGIEVLRSEKEGRKIILGGHSIGGCISLHISTQDHDILGVFTMATPTRYNYIIRKFGLMMYKIVPGLRIKYRPFIFYDKSFKKHPYVKFLNKNYGSVNVHVLGQVLKLMDHVYESMDEVTVPVKIIVSPKDKTIPKKSAYELYKLIKSTVKSVVYVYKAYHLITIDEDRGKVARSVIEFLEDFN